METHHEVNFGGIFEMKTSMEYQPFVSVIIPAYNRANMIGFTIESFIKQRYPSDRFEIIVADNNSMDSTKDVVLGLAARSPIPIIYLFEPKQGVHYARNTAAKHARGAILYYTDDDMVADLDLLAQIVVPFALDKKVAVVTGRVLPKWEIPPPQWVLDYCNNSLLSLSNPQEDLIIAPYDCGVFSCHQAISKSVLFQAGGFNPENTQGEWIGDGETGFNIKIRELGYKFAFNGRSKTFHMIPPTRMTQKYLNKRLANQGNCDSYTEYRKCPHTNAWLYLQIASHGKSLCFQAIRFSLKVLTGNSSWRLSLSRCYYFLNRMKYDYRLLHDADWRKLVLKYDWLSDEENSLESQFRTQSEPTSEIVHLTQTLP